MRLSLPKRLSQAESLSRHMCPRLPARQSPRALLSRPKRQKLQPQSRATRLSQKSQKLQPQNRATKPTMKRATLLRQSRAMRLMMKLMRSTLKSRRLPTISLRIQAMRIKQTIPLQNKKLSLTKSKILKLMKTSRHSPAVSLMKTNIARARLRQMKASGPKPPAKRALKTQSQRARHKPLERLPSRNQRPLPSPKPAPEGGLPTKWSLGIPNPSHNLRSYKAQRRDLTIANTKSG